VRPDRHAVTATPAAAETTTTAVGTLVTNSGTGLTTLADNPVHVGDVLVVGAEPGATTPTLTSVTGGGVTTWTKAVAFAGTTQPRDVEIWYGTVSATGSATITFNWSGSVAAQTPDYGMQEFNAGLGAGAVWTVDKTGHSDNASSTTVTYPSLTPTAAGETYFGFADVPNSPTGGGTSGFTYATTTNGNQVATNPSAGAGAVQPAATQTSAPGPHRLHRTIGWSRCALLNSDAHS